VDKRLVVSEGREELTTKATSDLLLNSERGAGGAVVSKEEVAAGRKGSKKTPQNVDRRAVGCNLVVLK
jgi:hypothetical protein